MSKEDKSLDDQFRQGDFVTRKDNEGSIGIVIVNPFQITEEWTTGWFKNKKHHSKKRWVMNVNHEYAYVFNGSTRRVSEGERVFCEDYVKVSR